MPLHRNTSAPCLCSSLIGVCNKSCAAVIENEAICLQAVLIFSAIFWVFSSSTNNTFVVLFNRAGFWKASLKIRSRHGCCNHLASFRGTLVSIARLMRGCNQQVKASSVLPQTSSLNSVSKLETTESPDSQRMFLCSSVSLRTLS